MTPTSEGRARLRWRQWVLAGGLIAGTVDIVYACVFWNWRLEVRPQRILQSVAAGLLGPHSFSGGWTTAGLGLALHYIIAMVVALIYYLAARRWSLLWRRALVCGGFYGLLVYGVMNYVVVPLSAAGPGSKEPLWIGLTILVHIVGIGIPCAIFARYAIREIQFRPPGPC